MNSCCSSKTTSCCPKQENTTQHISVTRYTFFSVATLALWMLLYFGNEYFCSWLIFSVFSLEGAIGSAIEFFIYDTVKILLLLILMVYVMAWLRASLKIEKIRNYLATQNRFLGYFLGTLFGAVTPFCSCSSIPLFLGFTSVQIPLGITMAFLITSPLINEIAVILLWSLLGWKLTLAYIAMGLLAGILGGATMDLLKSERWLQDYLKNMRSQKQNTLLFSEQKLTFLDRHAFAYDETKTILKRVWLWVLIGVGLGAILHGFVPQDWLLNHLGQNSQLWSVPLAVVIGIPLYTNVTGIVPIMQSLLLKGLPVGTTLAFCMSTVAASLPEVLMLKQVMKVKLLVLFLSLLLVIFTIMGWLLNYLSFMIH